VEAGHLQGWQANVLKSAHSAILPQAPKSKIALTRQRLFDNPTPVHQTILQFSKGVFQKLKAFGSSACGYNRAS
jgi:hypothetical protein